MKLKLTKATISVPEAGQILGVGRQAAYEAVHRGEIPAIRIGRLLRVPRAAFERMLQGQTPSAGPDARAK